MECRPPPTVHAAPHGVRDDIHLLRHKVRCQASSSSSSSCGIIIVIMTMMMTMMTMLISSRLQHKSFEVSHKSFLFVFGPSQSKAPVQVHSPTTSPKPQRRLFTLEGAEGPFAPIEIQSPNTSPRPPYKSKQERPKM